MKPRTSHNWNRHRNWRTYEEQINNPIAALRFSPLSATPTKRPGAGRALRHTCHAVGHPLETYTAAHRRTLLLAVYRGTQLPLQSHIDWTSFYKCLSRQPQQAHEVFLNSYDGDLARCVRATFSGLIRKTRKSRSSKRASHRHRNSHPGEVQ